MDKNLKEYMREHFDFGSMKKVGIFPKEMKFNDYEGQAKIICRMFDLDSIYDYHKIGAGTPVHISYVHPTPFDRFVEIIGGPILKVEGKTAKVVSITTRPSAPL